MKIRLRETCLFLAVACNCAAQTISSLSKEQLRAAWEKDWTKVSDVPFNLLEDCGAPEDAGQECNQSPSPQRSGASLVSAPHLRHKVPKEATKAFQRALTLSHSGDHQKAEDELERAILLDPEFAEAYANVGIEYASTGSYQLAEARFRKAIELDPASPVAYCNLGVLLIKVGRTREAESAIRRALELSPDDPNAHFLLARLLLGAATNRIEAEQHLKMAARTIPSAKVMLKGLRNDGRL
jgi:Flp pilus assembly protein TadD